MLGTRSLEKSCKLLLSKKRGFGKLRSSLSSSTRVLSKLSSVLTCKITRSVNSLSKQGKTERLKELSKTVLAKLEQVVVRETGRPGIVGVVREGKSKDTSCNYKCSRSNKVRELTLE